MAATTKRATGLYLAHDAVAILDEAAGRLGVSRANVVERLARLYAPSLRFDAGAAQSDGAVKKSRKNSKKDLASY